MGKRIFSLLLAVCLLSALAAPGLTVCAAQLDGQNLSLQVNGGEPVTVKAYQSSYGNNLLLSLRDVAAAVSGTEKRFDIAIAPDPEGGTRIVITFDQDYTPIGGEGAAITALDVTDSIYASTAYNKLYFGDQEMRLATYLHKPYEDRAADIFLRMVDLGLYFNLNLEYTGEGALSVETAADYLYDLDAQDADGYFQDLHGVVLADAQTGRVFYAYHADSPTQIASTTKLMTYLLVREAMDAGELGMDTLYTVSQDVYRLANSEDGIYRKRGKNGTLSPDAQVTVRDLLSAMLVVSANEAALALAEMVSGSEEAFVERMNQRAEELGLSSTIFYNPHGLPDYTQAPATSKRQNEMSPMDMFRLTQYLLTHYREDLTAITSQTKVELPSFGQTVDGKTAFAKTTNALLYNLPECLGLKTGTTNRSGANLVSTMPVTDVNGQTHDLVVVLFGAEDDGERCEKTAWLFRYAQQYFAANPFPQEEPETTQATVPPTTEVTLPPTTQATVPATVPAPQQPQQTGPGWMVVIAAFLAGVGGTLIVVLLVSRAGKKRDYHPRFGR